MKQILDNLSKL